MHPTDQRLSVIVRGYLRRVIGKVILEMIAETLAEFRQEVNSRLERVENRLDQVENRLDKLENDFQQFKAVNEAYQKTAHRIAN